MKMIGFALLFFSLGAFAQGSTPCAKSRVTMITDSHGVGPIGKAVGTWLLELPGYQKRFHLLGGSSPRWWMNDKWKDKYPDGVKTKYAIDYDSCKDSKAPTWAKKEITTARSKNVEILLPKPSVPFENDLVILGQGTNIVSTTGDYREMTRDLVLRIRRQAPGSSCVWIGPPDMLKIGKNKRPMESMAKVYKAIQEGLDDAQAILQLEFPAVKRPPCHLIDSRKYSQYPTWPLDAEGFAPDGVHYPFAPPCTPELSKSHPNLCRDFGGEWGRGVVEEIKQVMEKELGKEGVPLELPETPCPGDHHSTRAL